MRENHQIIRQILYVKSHDASNRNNEISKRKRNKQNRKEKKKNKKKGIYNSNSNAITIQTIFADQICHPGLRTSRCGSEHQPVQSGPGHAPSNH